MRVGILASLTIAPIVMARPHKPSGRSHSHEPMAEAESAPAGVRGAQSSVLRSDKAARVTPLNPASLAHYAELYDLAPVGYATLDPAGRIEEINRTGADMLGWTPRWLAGHLLSKWIIAEDAASFGTHLRNVATGGGSTSVQLRLKNRYGRVRDVQLESSVSRGSGQAAGRCLTIMLDISEHRRGEREARVEQAKLMQAGRVNMMGEIASSLAHELNQPLGAILLNSNACLQMIRGAATGTDFAKLDATLTRVCDSAAYAGEIIRHLRRFLRTGDGERKPIDINALIIDAMRMAEPDARDHEVTIRLELASSLPSAQADAVQIEQVLLNLVRNSIDAMAGSTSLMRQITIRTELSVGGQVRFSVADSGPGAPAHIAARLFDPFFTTKTGGMGLGLAISRSIVEAHTGRLWLDPDTKSGATFLCSLPIAASPSP